MARRKSIIEAIVDGDSLRPVHQELDAWAFELEQAIKQGNYENRGKIQRKLAAVWKARDKAYCKHRANHENPSGLTSAERKNAGFPIPPSPSPTRMVKEGAKPRGMKTIS